MAVRIRMPGRGLDGPMGLFALVALLTLLPAACVLWFMNDALTREASSAEQRVLESYRGQLRLVRSRLDPLWRAHAERLNSGGRPDLRFERLIRGELADGALVLAADGAVAYPTRGNGSAPEAQALQQRLAAIAGMAPGDREAAIESLAGRLNDYMRAFPPEPRLALMKDLRRLSPNVHLPTQAALDLSLEMLDAERPTPIPDVIRQTAMPDIWALTSADQRVIALYRTGRLEAMMHDFLHQVAPAGIAFIATPPDVPTDAEAIAAGAWLPGWQLTFVPLDRPADAAGVRRRALYLSVAVAGIAVMSLTGLTMVGALRRHLRVARLKTDLVAAASHELRTPLASMRVLIDGLLADAELDPPKTREYLGMLASENARLSRLIENFLSYSKLDRRQHTFALAPTPPSAVVEAAVGAVRDRVPPGCNLRVDIDAGARPVMVDADALSTALVNLLDNAIKYTRDHPRIIVRAAEEDGWVVFSVQDNGIGIPVREQGRIFRRFYQIDRRLSRETGGVGLGLSIVDLIVRGHGGRVQVHSSPGEGSTFTLRLPRAAEGGTA